MLTLRVASRDDGECLSRIYAHYVNTSPISYEYVAPTVEEFSERIAHKLEKYPFIVALLDGEPIGYAYASQYRERAAFDWCVELSVYVSRHHLGRGIGTALYTALLELLRLQNIVVAYSAITLPNDQSIALHSKMGFDLAGVFKASGYKMEQWWELAWYQKQLNPLTCPPPAVIPFPQLDAEAVASVLKKSERN